MQRLYAIDIFENIIQNYYQDNQLNISLIAVQLSKIGPPLGPQSLVLIQHTLRLTQNRFFISFLCGPLCLDTRKQGSNTNRLTQANRNMSLHVPSARQLTASPHSIGEQTADASSFYVATAIVESAVDSFEQGEPEKALKLFATALKTQRLTLGDIDLCVAHTLGNIGSVYLNLGWYDDASQVLEESLNIRLNLRDDRSNLPQGCEDIDLYDTLNNLGSVEFLRGDYIKAMSYFQDCLKEITAGEVPGSTDMIASTLYNIGHIHSVLCEYEDGLIAMQESLQLTQSVFGHEDIIAAEIIEKIGAIHMHQNNLDDALSSFVESLRITKMGLGSAHVDCAPSLYNVGLVYDLKNESRRAMDSYKAALEIYGKNQVENADVDRIRQRMMQLKVHVP